MKFSIRDLLLVTVIVALAVAWWVDRSRLADAEKQLQEHRDWLGELGPGDYEVVPIRQPGDPTVKRGISVRPTLVPNSQAPAPNTPKK